MKVSWLAKNVRPDLAYSALKLSQKSQQLPTIGDLKSINKLVKKIKGRTSEIVYTKVGDSVDLVVYGIGDASHKRGEKSVGGEVVLLGHKNRDTAVAVYWKSKTIKNVCKSPKDAETRNISQLVDNARYIANQIGFVLFGKKGKNAIPVKIFTDSLPLLESIASIHRVEEKLMQDWVDFLKEKLESREVNQYSWLDSDDMLADMLTKDMKETNDMLEILWRNKFRLYDNSDNLVTFKKNEFCISNRKLKNNAIQ